MQSPTTQTNKNLNMLHQENLRKVRPKQPNYDWVSLEAVIRKWVTSEFGSVVYGPQDLVKFSKLSVDKDTV